MLGTLVFDLVLWTEISQRFVSIPCRYSSRLLMAGTARLCLNNLFMISCAFVRAQLVFDPILWTDLSSYTVRDELTNHAMNQHSVLKLLPCT